ncbi:hypothetical protein SAMN06296241_1347 [Salinimicrobium sediminis]|uniref:Uncharacterized protein n=1 Tax=Salinimicrobium sediminis TaxID=1343891 RepID=A0A285X370_9FLAO|nr:hypothetical protein [Salinimicrobium sediminis]SOC79810.1 hypothetical protein SAMN06296241_1347 [Salinimicrobium sediminis]
MKLTFQHYLIVAVLILLTSTGLSTYRLIQEQERNTALEASVEILEKNNEDFLQKNFDLIDSLKVQKKERVKAIEKRDQKIEDILTYVDQILKKTPNEKAVDNMRDADSINQLFSRYYPDHSGAGQGSN